MMYPTGLLVDYDGDLYRIDGERLLPFVSFRAGFSWNQPILVADTDTIEDNYSVSKAKLGFRPASIIKSKTEDTQYFIEGTHKRAIDKYAYRLLGFNEFETIEVEDFELAFHPTGDPIG
jgi:hypothetical protein